MEHYNLNKTMCEELFGGELDVTEETVDPFETSLSGMVSRRRRRSSGRCGTTSRIPYATSTPSST